MKRNPYQQQNISNTTFDLIVVGGGITGAGVLLEASKIGYKTLLIEKGDFASGTSSRSAKLAHGGLRYLQYGHFKLVRESLKERDFLLNKYPHLVKPLSFLYPLYTRKLKIQVFLGLCVYQLLNFSSNLSGFKFLNKKKTLKKFSVINSYNLKGSFVYYDAVTNDSRLCNEIIHDAINDYSSLAYNYLELISFEKLQNKVQVKCFDHIENKEVVVTSKFLINASGPWMDELAEKIFSKSTNATAPSKGTHIVLSKKDFPVNSSLLFSTKANDNRWLYTVPWENDTVIIGATDTEYSDGIDKVDVEIEDDQYILNAINHIVPSLKISKDHVISSFAGVRPLLKNDAISSKDRSREYKIWWLNDRVLNVFGGKLTGFRSMGEKAIKLIAEKEIISKKNPKKIEQKKMNIKLNELPDKFILLIKEKYNKESFKIFKICFENPSAIELLHEDFDIYMAEIIYFARHQSCYHIDDLLGRRLSLSYILPKFKDRLEVIRKTAEILSIECCWDEQEYSKEQENYINLINKKNLYL